MAKYVYVGSCNFGAKHDALAETIRRIHLSR